MMRVRPWAKIPTDWILNGEIQAFAWKDDGSAGTASLMLFYALCQFAYERPLRPGEIAPPKNVEVAAEGLGIACQPQSRPSVDVVPNTASVQPPATTEASASQNPPWAQFLAPSAETASQTVGVAGIGGGALPGTLHVRPNPAILAGPQLVECGASQGGTWGRTAGTVESDNFQAVVVADAHHAATVARLTYEDINALTGLSKKLISAGIKKLVERQLIWRVDGSGTYGILALTRGKHWAKVPGQALMSKGQTSFLPFNHFSHRSKHELNALKVYFYYAATRDRAKPYSEPSFEKIFVRTGVSERDIPRANSLLITSGLLASTRSAPTEDTKKYESNHYYMMGHSSLFLPIKAAV